MTIGYFKPLNLNAEKKKNHMHYCNTLATSCAINILYNKSGFIAVATEPSSEGYWHNGILVHGVT